MLLLSARLAVYTYICFLCDIVGPLPNTVAEFWQMVWEQRCEIIVMLTGLVEGGKVNELLVARHLISCTFVQRKCTQYWPEPQDDVLQYGNIEVKFLAQKQYSFYNYTTLEISQVCTCVYWPLQVVMKCGLCIEPRHSKCCDEKR